VRSLECIAGPIATMVHGVPLASPQAGVFVHALARASLCVCMRGWAHARLCRSNVPLRRQYDLLLQQCTLKARFEEAPSAGGGGGGCRFGAGECLALASCAPHPLRPRWLRMVRRIDFLRNSKLYVGTHLMTCCFRSLCSGSNRFTPTSPRKLQSLSRRAIRVPRHRSASQAKMSMRPWCLARSVRGSGGKRSLRSCEVRTKRLRKLICSR
jgi:hypothetical protein